MVLNDGDVHGFDDFATVFVLVAQRYIVGSAEVRVVWLACSGGDRWGAEWWATAARDGFRVPYDHLGIMWVFREEHKGGSDVPLRGR